MVDGLAFLSTDKVGNVMDYLQENIPIAERLNGLMNYFNNICAHHMKYLAKKLILYTKAQYSIIIICSRFVMGFCCRDLNCLISGDFSQQVNS